MQRLERFDAIVPESLRACMVLCEQQKKILHAVIMRANVPEAEIARMLELQQHTVRRAIRFFLESGVFVRRCVFVDPHALGLSNYLVRLSLPVSARKHYESFVQTLVDAEETVGLVEFGGDRHLELRVYTTDATHLQRFFENLAQRVKHSFHVEECFLILDQEYSGTFDQRLSLSRPTSLRFRPRWASEPAALLDENDHETVRLRRLPIGVDILKTGSKFSVSVEGVDLLSKFGLRAL